MLSIQLGYSFIDIDEEVERFYQKPIERIQDESLTMNRFRDKASIVLDNILSMREQSIRLGLSERRRTRLPIRRLSDTSSVVIAVYVWSRWNMH